MKEFDLKGIRCPIPIVELSRIVQQLDPEEEFRVLATDPAFQLDVEAWCRRTGHELVSRSQEGDVLSAEIRVRTDEPARR